MLTYELVRRKMWTSTHSRLPFEARPHQRTELAPRHLQMVLRQATQAVLSSEDKTEAREEREE